MTFPSLKSEKSSKRSNSRSRSRSRSNRRRTRKHRNRNKRNNDNNNGNNSRMNNNNNNNNNNFNNKMEIDSDDSNHSLLSSPINELNLTESASISSYTSSTSSLLSLSSSTPAPCSSNIVRGKNKKNKARHRRRNRNKRKLNIINNDENNDKNTIKKTKEQCLQIEQEQNDEKNEMKEQKEPHNEQELEQEEKKEIIQDIENEEEEKEEEEEMREFRFNIENDSNLRDIINNNINREDLNEFGLLPTNITSATRTVTNNNNNNAINIDDDMNNRTNNDELTSEYILSKLYNYMKISEMSKYGISVFEMTFTSYLPYLTENDLNKLATSYWCNGQHFKCMIAHRGDLIKTNNYLSRHERMSVFDDDEEEEEEQQDINNNKNTKKNISKLQLKIDSELLDAAMQSGASVDKIEAMLLQKRIDEGVNNKKLIKKVTNNNNCKNKKDGKALFYHTKYEKNFYLRNLKHRFWNHEVLVRVFIQNGWLTSNLADTAMKTFIKTIYHRVLESKLNQYSNNNKSNQSRHKRSNNNKNNIKFSENFLHSFFVSYFCLDDIPKMYKQEINKKMNGNNNNNNHKSSIISEETLRRWCELIELLASRGANINEYEFKKVIPLQYALQLGKNTYKFISSTHSKKNNLLLPHSYQQENITVPNDIWDVLVSYL